MIAEYPLPGLDEAYPGIKLLRRAAPRLVKDLERTQSTAREFGRKYIEPVALDIDDRIGQDHSYFPWDIVQRAGEHGYLSFILPRIAGGGGHSSVAGAILMEELGAHCAGVACIIGVNNLGLAPLAVNGYDMHKYYLFVKDTIKAERSGHPVLWAFALTEPDAGSDAWSETHIDGNHTITSARRTQRGYVLNGRKIFISNGSVARYVSTYAVLDQARPSETMLSVVVPSDTPGFRVSRVESKMGQRACPTAELEFEDVFVPETHRLGPEGSGFAQAEAVSSITRGPVAAIAVGIARGALQRVWAYAAGKIIGDHRLIDEQWVQIALSDMIMQIHAARQAYFISALMVDINNPVLSAALGGRGSPRPLLDSVASATLDNGLSRSIFTLPSVNKFMASLFAEKDTAANRNSLMLRSVLASAAKTIGSDVAMSVTARALDIAGADGSRRELGLEKRFRDAKIIQIYEGTNQILRLSLFRKTASR